MPDVTVHTGPYAGTYDGLESLLEAQGLKQHGCLHLHESRRRESGVAGKGLDRFRFSRARCMDCLAVVESSYVHEPDIEEERRARDEFMRRLPDAPENRFYVVMRLGKEWFLVWSTEASCLSVAQRTIADYWDLAHFGGERCRRLYPNCRLEVVGKEALLGMR